MYIKSEYLCRFFFLWFNVSSVGDEQMIIKNEHSILHQNDIK